MRENYWKLCIKIYYEIDLECLIKYTEETPKETLRPLTLQILIYSPSPQSKMRRCGALANVPYFKMKLEALTETGGTIY